MTDALDLDALEKLAEAATEGPWKEAYTTLPGGPYDSIVSPDGRRVCGLIAIGSDRDREKYSPETTVANAVFIAASREAIPALVRRVRELEEALEPMRVGAREADYYCGDDVDDEHRVLIDATVGDLRRARALLHKETNGDSKP